MLFSSLMPNGWEKGYAKFSDWKNKPCDYATNAIVHNFYNEKQAKWYRTNKFNQFVTLGDKKETIFPVELLRKIENKDTLVIGLDYYAYTGLCYQLIPKEFRVFSEKVRRFKIFLREKRIVWQEIN